jgi:ribulose 1,5-bisphosphate synthetase/thiazole synthase
MIMRKFKKQRISRRQFLPAGLVALSGNSLLPAHAAVTASGHPTLDTTEVLVVGGGPAGIGAALGAARAGAKTLLIENHSFFGGIGAWQVGMPLNSMRPESKPRSQVHELLIQKLQAMGDQAAKLTVHGVLTNVEYLKVAVLDALDAVGAKYFVHVRAVDTVVEGDRVTGVVIGTKRGLMTLRAKVVVDCTGDADVAYYAGAETMMDPKELMPVTLGLALTNIDTSKVQAEEILSAIQRGKAKYPLITSGFMEMLPIANSHSWWINHAGTSDLGRVDATDPVERTMAECFSRRQALQMVRALRESDNPALSSIEWVAAGPQVGVRETRRVKGVYILTEQDALAGRIFEDTIAWRAGFVDQGGIKGIENFRMKIHDVPYRALLPEKVDGLLVGGRCISTTHVGAGAGKAMGNCMATGHAAGVAAALSARKGIMPRELKISEVQARLRADGVDLEVKDRDQKNLRET